MITALDLPKAPHWYIMMIQSSSLGSLYVQWFMHLSIRTLGLWFQPQLQERPQKQCKQSNTSSVQETAAQQWQVTLQAD